MGLLHLNPLCKFLIRQTLPVTRCRHQKLSVLAQKIEHTTRPKQQPIPIQHEQASDPYVLVASELVHIRKRMLTMLDTAAHPGLSEIADYYFLHPSKQLRSLLVLLFARATNGLGTCWERKHWDATCETSSGLSEELDRPLTLSGVLNDWNPSMPDNTASFETVFHVQRPTPRPPRPPFPSFNSSISPSLMSPPTLLPTQIRLAQIVEMIHIASLLHDNILNSNNVQSASDPFGNKLSVLGGDFLLGRASTALPRLGESEVVELIANVISNLVEGEILRMDHVRTPELGLVEGPLTVQAAWELYFRKTYLKNSSLMAKGARSAVILGGCKEGDIWREVAYAYSRNLGIAHQLMEDVRELQNLQPGLVTAPVLFASEECPRLLPLIQRYCTEPGDTELAIERVRSTSGIQRSRLLAEAYAAKARDVLHLLPDSNEKTALETLTEVIVK